MRLLKLALAVTGLQLIVGAILLPVWLLAGTIVRSTKAGSTTSFATSNSLGNVLAVADLDTDLNNAYTAINGGLDNSNIAVAANIATSKLATDAGLTNAHLSATAGIVGTKLAVGAAVHAFTASSDISNAISINTTETDIATATITTRGGRVRLSSAWFLIDDIGGSATGETTIRAYRDATLLRTWIRTVSVNGANEADVPNLEIYDAPATGTYIYKFTAQTTAVGHTVHCGNGVTSAQCGFINVIEWS